MFFIKKYRSKHPEKIPKNSRVLSFGVFLVTLKMHLILLDRTTCVSGETQHRH